jgi:glycine cleavage system H lipoate-binding protein
VKVNELLAAHPDMGCTDPYGVGWIAKLAPSEWDTERVYLLGVNEYLTL